MKFRVSEFLDYVINPDGTEMGDDKIDTIPEWQVLRSLRDIQSFLGFVNFW
jgi:hypothetical protein